VRIIIDPTSENSTSLFFNKKIWYFPHSRRDCGSNFVCQIAKLGISVNDELAVVVGPGNFTAIRMACLIGNSIRFLTNCQLLARQKSDPKFKKVQKLIPFYSVAPSITVFKK